LRRARALATTAALLLTLPATSTAAPSVKLTAGFIPDRLNTPTTISFGVHISTPGAVPPPLTGIALQYPVDLGLATSGIGLADCLPNQLQTYGPTGCPSNSLMGHGTATAELPLPPETFTEKARITLVAGPPTENHLSFLVYAEANTPVSAEILFSALLLPEPAPFGGRLQFNVPIVPGLPRAPDVSIVSLHTTLGPLGLIYHERIHGKTISYHPQGIISPPTCPHGGFPFAATLTFQDDTTTQAHTTVPCPGVTHRAGIRAARRRGSA
jgi:hypothetical protein